MEARLTWWSWSARIFREVSQPLDLVPSPLPPCHARWHIQFSSLYNPFPHSTLSFQVSVSDSVSDFIRFHQIEVWSYVWTKSLDFKISPQDIGHMFETKLLNFKISPPDKKVSRAALSRSFLWFPTVSHQLFPAQLWAKITKIISNLKIFKISTLLFNIRIFFNIKDLKSFNLTKIIFNIRIKDPILKVYNSPKTKIREPVLKGN